MTKTCYKCGQEKPLSEFWRSAKGKHGRGTICRDCGKIRNHEYHSANRDRGNQQSREWRVKHLERAREIVRENKRRYKLQAIAAYGGRCACCGETGSLFLTIDHVNGDGAAHRRQLGSGKNIGSYIYLWLKKENYPEGFQVLCFNCNCARHLNGGICPHQMDAVTREEFVEPPGRQP